MKILADENFPRPVVGALRKQGYDVLWARADCAGLTDRALLELAEADGRIVLTLDRDFWELALQRPVPLRRSGVILFRVHPAVPVTVQEFVDRTLRLDRSWAGHMSIVTRSGVEMITSK